MHLSRPTTWLWCCRLKWCVPSKPSAAGGTVEASLQQLLPLVLPPQLLRRQLAQPPVAQVGQGLELEQQPAVVRQVAMAMVVATVESLLLSSARAGWMSRTCWCQR